MLSLCVHQRGGERKSLPAHRVYLSLYPEAAHWNCDIAKIELEGCVKYIGTRPLSRTNIVPKFFHFPIPKGWADERIWTAKGCLCGRELKDPGNEVGAGHAKRLVSWSYQLAKHNRRRNKYFLIISLGAFLVHFFLLFPGFKGICNACKGEDTISLMFGNWQVFSRCKNGCLKTCPESQVERTFPLIILTSSISLR